MDFIAQAFKGKIQWYHYLLTTLLWFIIMQFGSIPLIIAQEFADSSSVTASNLNPGIDDNLFLFIMIIPFALGLLGLFLGLKKINKRSILSVLTTRQKFDWKRVAYAFAIWFGISVVLILIDYSLSPEHYVFNFKPIPFLILTLVSFLFMPFQTGFEEVLFRGYLMQAFGVLTKKRWAALVVTSIAFGLLHGANPEVEKLGRILLIYYVATGFLFGIITLMDDGIELTFGLHTANNIVAALFVTTNWTVFQTDALFTDISEPHINWLMFFPVIVVYPLLLFWLSKKYNWHDWRHKLFGNVEVPQEYILDNSDYEDT